MFAYLDNVREEKGYVQPSRRPEILRSREGRDFDLVLRSALVLLSKELEVEEAEVAGPTEVGCRVLALKSNIDLGIKKDRGDYPTPLSG